MEAAPICFGAFDIIFIRLKTGGCVENIPCRPNPLYHPHDPYPTTLMMHGDVSRMSLADHRTHAEVEVPQFAPVFSRRFDMRRSMPCPTPKNGFRLACPFRFGLF